MCSTQVKVPRGADPHKCHNPHIHLAFPSLMVPIRRRLWVLFQVKPGKRFISGLKANFSTCIGQECHESGYAALKNETNLRLKAHQTRYTGLQCDRWSNTPPLLISFHQILSSHDQGGRSIPSPPGLGQP